MAKTPEEANAVNASIELRRHRQRLPGAGGVGQIGALAPDQSQPPIDIRFVQHDADDADAAVAIVEQTRQKGRAQTRRRPIRR